jgi:Origin recognition complex subunit 2
MNHEFDSIDREVSETSTRVIAHTPVTFHSKYPGIQDYDKLRYHQLRYSFSDHDFLSLQWKAMQSAGWTYSGGKYKSPKGTRVYDNVNEMNAQLDSCAVGPVHGNFRFAHDSLATGVVFSEDDESTERIEDLRNSICYHMQLSMEKWTADTAHNMSVPNTADDSSVVGCIPPIDMISNIANPLTNTELNTARNNSSITAMEKGSDLYLQRTKRLTTSTNRMKKGAAITNNTTVYATIDNGNIERTLPEFPTTLECAEIMSSFGIEACERIEASLEQHHFARWRFLLSTNHSLLFYGNGSKHCILSKFCEAELCQEGYCLQVEGFDSDVSMEGILDLLVLVFLNGKEPNPTPYEAVPCLPQQWIPGEGFCHGKFSNDTAALRSYSSNARILTDRAAVVGLALAEHCVRTGSPIYLVIHSLEACLRTDIEQDALAALIRYAVTIRLCESRDSDVQHNSPFVLATLRLVASVDHVDATAAFCSSMTSYHLSWIWNAIHTYRPYLRELAILTNTDDIEETRGSKTLQRRRRQQARVTEQGERVLQVLKNLAPRYGEVMQILAQLQLAEFQSTSLPWVDYKVFRAACKSRFVIDKDSKLRTLQAELSDHRLMISKTEGPVEYVSIPYSEAKLRDIVAFQRSVDK